jgi:hypothetical protein
MFADPCSLPACRQAGSPILNPREHSKFSYFAAFQLSAQVTNEAVRKSL